MGVSSVSHVSTAPAIGVEARGETVNSTTLPSLSIFRNNFIINNIAHDWSFGRQLVSGRESNMLVKGVGVLCGTSCVVVGAAARLTGIAFLFSCAKDILTRMFNWVSGKIYNAFLDSLALYHTRENKAVERLLDSAANDVVSSLETMANANGRAIQVDRIEAKAALSKLILKNVLTAKATASSTKSEPLLKSFIEENIQYIQDVKRYPVSSDPDSMLKVGVANMATAVVMGYAQPGDKAENIVAALELKQVVERLKPVADQFVDHLADKAKKRGTLLASFLIKDAEPSGPSMSASSDDNGSRRSRESVCTRVTSYFSGLPGRAMSPFFDMVFMPSGFAED